jgi:hypothetical protein
MMEAMRTSETSVYPNETIWRYIPKGSNLHTRRHENLKSHSVVSERSALISGKSVSDVLASNLIKTNVFVGVGRGISYKGAAMG